MSLKERAILLYKAGMSKHKIANELGVHRKSVQRYTEGLELTNQQQIIIDPKIGSDQRAKNLADTLFSIITKSFYPVVNPESLIVEARVASSFNPMMGTLIERPGAPQVYISDVLRVAPIEDYKGRRFLFTRAQNATEVNLPLLKNMEAYAKERGADIVVGPSTYETSWWTENAEHCRTYDENIEKYLCFGRMDIGPNFFFSAETNILTTAATPINDLVSYSRGKWCVVPHSKQNLVSIPTTDPDQLCSQILSTGSITIPKVIAKKAGLKSIFHHIFGFVVAEFDDEGRVFCRHVNADADGSFYDLNWYVNNGVADLIDYKADPLARPDYLMPGDIHVGKLDLANPKDVIKTFGFTNEGDKEEKNLISEIMPRRLILQDLHDGNVDNHYTHNDLGQKVENIKAERDNLQWEIEEDGIFLHSLQWFHPYLEEIIVDESNHDIRLERWVREKRYDTDGVNARFGLQLHDKYLEYRENCGMARERGEKPYRFSLHEYAIRKAYPGLENVSWVYDGESRIINDVEVGHHGFRGVNGSKASTAGYARMGKKISTGDPHSPGIQDGVFRAGVMALKQQYNKGPSSWCVSHILQYANGKRCMITMNDGNYQYAAKGRPLNG